MEWRFFWIADSCQISLNRNGDGATLCSKGRLWRRKRKRLLEGCRKQWQNRSTRWFQQRNWVQWRTRTIHRRAFCTQFLPVCASESIAGLLCKICYLFSSSIKKSFFLPEWMLMAIPTQNMVNPEKTKVH